MPERSTKPYLIRAIHEWCMDSGYTPYLSVRVDENTRVPMEYVKNGEIVLNVSYDATHKLTITNDLVQFSARFSGGVARMFGADGRGGRYFRARERPWHVFRPRNRHRDSDRRTAAHPGGRRRTGTAPALAAATETSNRQIARMGSARGWRVMA